MTLDPKHAQLAKARAARGATRNRFCKKFLEDALDSWEKHGAAAFEELRWDDPAAYIAAMSRILPKDIQIEVSHSSLSAEERERALEVLREHLVNLTRQQQLTDERQKQLLIDARVEDAVAN